MNPEQSPYVVVGAGLAGAATAWRLAEAGHDVTIVERGRPADRGGSSHGSARIFRSAYRSAFYTALATRSRPLWSELEEATGRTLIDPRDCADWGELRGPHTLLLRLQEAGVDHELLSAAEASARWDIAFDTPVLRHHAGVIDAERSVTAMLDLATSHGARLLTDWELTRIEPTASGYRLTSATADVLDAGRLVLCAGGFLPRLLEGAGVDARFVARMPRLSVTQEQAYHFPYRDGPERSHAPGRAWPTFIHKTDEIQTYSLPGGRDADHRGQKIAEFAAGRPLASAHDQDRVIDPAHRARMVAYVERYLPGLVPEPYAETTCLFTSTPTEDFVLDRVDGLTVLSPCSGHGAKFAPLIGILGAHLASARTVSTGRAAVPREFLLAEGPPAVGGLGSLAS